jgi:hypothetical protein
VHVIFLAPKARICPSVQIQIYENAMLALNTRMRWKVAKYYNFATFHHIEHWLVLLLNTNLSYFRVSQIFSSFYRFAIRPGGGRTSRPSSRGCRSAGLRFSGRTEIKGLDLKLAGVRGSRELRCSDLALRHRTWVAGGASPDVGCRRCVALPEVCWSACCSAFWSWVFRTLEVI